MAQPDPARRALLSGAMLTSNGRARVARLNQTWGPCPPWLIAPVQSGQCANCGRPCQDACATEIIQFYPQHHAAADAPYLSFEDGGCTFCGACIEVCPGIDQPPEVLPPIGSALLNHDQCLAWGHVMCISCRGACPRHAIDCDRGMRPSVNRGACTGCGLCVGVCPTHAISVAVYDALA